MSRGFAVFPAIDLLGGRCVRLRQGDYGAVTVYSDDPAGMAMSFLAAGADSIHLVDLDAARSGIPANHALIAEIASRTGLFVQAGGGIRNMETLDRILASGVSRAILGTAAVRDRAFVEAAVRRYGARIAAGIDARGGEVAVGGWTEGSGRDVLDLALEMEQIGVQTVIYTDIARDGMMTGTQTGGIRRLKERTGLRVIASGGIGSIADVTDAMDAGADGAIIGKAIYEGKVDLAECLRSVSSRALTSGTAGSSKASISST